MKWLVLAVALNVFVRYLISIHGYSGAGQAPMYGDYEAQRHWMEITTNLPTSEWYSNSTNNDLLYWGLDYPPLTAYHSWLVGKVAHHIEPGSMVLMTSRGYETITSKILFRGSVIISDILMYLPAVYYLCKQYVASGNWNQMKAALFLSMQPALLLIDHGHFQYNGVSLGLALFSFVSILNDMPVAASIFFSLSLNFKQMGLYYSTTIFFYLLGSSISKRDITGSILRVGKIGMAVIITFAICWLPFLSSIDDAKQVLHRIFPVARGLFEDKVANFWCSVSPFIKFKTLFSRDMLLLLSLACTLVSILPSGLSLLFRPNKQTFVFSLIASSFGFFLFSFQVHEKSILLPLLPISMLIMSKEHAFFASWLQQIAVFSMYPLLSKDGLALPYMIAMLIMTLYTFDVICQYSTDHAKQMTVTYIISVFGMVVIHSLSLIMEPPQKLPDLFVMLFAMYSFVHFFGSFLYVNYLALAETFRPNTQYVKPSSNKKTK